MNTAMRAATAVARVPEKMKGVNTSPSSTARISSASMRLRNFSPERSQASIATDVSVSRYGQQALGLPQQHQHHQQQRGAERQLGHQVAHVVGREPHQQRAEHGAR